MSGDFSICRAIVFYYNPIILFQLCGLVFKECLTVMNYKFYCDICVICVHIVITLCDLVHLVSL